MAFGSSTWRVERQTKEKYCFAGGWLSRAIIRTLAVDLQLVAVCMASFVGFVDFYFNYSTHVWSFDIGFSLPANGKKRCSLDFFLLFCANENVNRAHFITLNISFSCWTDMCIASAEQWQRSSTCASTRKSNDCFFRERFVLFSRFSFGFFFLVQVENFQIQFAFRYSFIKWKNHWNSEKFFISIRIVSEWRWSSRQCEFEWKASRVAFRRPERTSKLSAEAIISPTCRNECRRQIRIANRRNSWMVPVTCLVLNWICIRMHKCFIAISIPIGAILMNLRLTFKHWEIQTMPANERWCINCPMFEDYVRCVATNRLHVWQCERLVSNAAQFTKTKWRWNGQ